MRAKAVSRSCPVFGALPRSDPGHLPIRLRGYVPEAHKPRAIRRAIAVLRSATAGRLGPGGLQWFGRLRARPETDVRDLWSRLVVRRTIDQHDWRYRYSGMATSVLDRLRGLNFDRREQLGWVAIVLRQISECMD